MKFLFPFVAAASLAAGASAGFTGFKTVTSINGDGHVVSKVYANFSGDVSATLLNIYQILYTGGIGSSDIGAGNFYHTDLIGGTWNPLFATGTDTDSYVTIGGVPGIFGGNSTAADPGWGVPGFNQAGLVDGGVAGWYNGNPPNLQGLNVDGKVLIGQFVTDVDKTWDIFAKLGFNHGLSTVTEFDESTFTIGIPAPGAIALLGLAGLAGRRRRA